MLYKPPLILYKSERMIFKSILPYIFFLLISFLLCHIFFAGLGSENFFFIHDEYLALTKWESSHSFFMQNPVDFGSGYTTHVLVGVFERLYYYLGHMISDSFYEIQYVSYFLKIFLSLLLPYLGFRLLYKVFSKNTESSLIVMAISLFYTFNTFTLIYWHANAFSLTALMSYILAPLGFYFVYKSIFERNEFYFKIVAVLLLFLMSFAIYLFAVFSIILFFFSLMLLILEKKKRLMFLKNLSVLILLYTPFLPMNSLFFYEMFFSSTDTVNTSGGETYMSIQGQFLYPMLMWFTWAMYTFWQPRNVFTFVDYFRLMPSLVAPFILYALIIIQITKQKLTAVPVALMVSFLVVLFIIKASQPPFGEVFQFLLDYFPPFRVFRSPDSKFGFGIVLLISLQLIYLYGNVMRIKKIISFFILVVVIIQGLPLFTGLAIKGENTESSTDRIIKLTGPYMELATYINTQTPQFGYVIPIPPSEFGKYNLGEGVSHLGQDILPKMVHYPFAYLSEYSGMTKDAYAVFKSGLSGNDLTSLNLFPIQYYLIRNDIVQRADYSALTHSVKQNNELVFENELFQLYKNNQGSPIASASGATITRISPVEYHFSFDRLNAGTELVLNQNFNRNWRIYSEKHDSLLGSILYTFNQPLFSESHYSANNYANGWKSDKDYDQPVTFVVYYVIQSYLILTASIAVVYFIILLLTLALKPMKRIVIRP